MRGSRSRWCLPLSLVLGAAAIVVAGGGRVDFVDLVAADACTPSGVALFAPLSRRRHWLLPSPVRIPTGSARELVVAVMIAAAAVAATVALALAQRRTSGASPSQT